MTTFKDLGLAEPILQAVLAEGYETPTPIQAQAIPTVLKGRDVLGIAQTGTGKTAAFVLPQLDRMARARTAPASRSATVLMLTPTRELAAQIADAIHTYGKALKPSVAIVIGGAKPGPQIRSMARGVDFLVATPGRLLDLMEQGAVTLDSVKTLVLDEADQMLDLGFLPAVRRIVKWAPSNRQTLLFSATMPKQIRRLADDFLSDPVEIAVTPASKPIERIDQSVMFVEKNAKARVLASLLKDDAIDRAVVFTRTKHGANRLCQQLGRAGIHAEPIHGNKSQSQREKTLAAFRAGKLAILVATDIAARGIDIDDVSHVFNYELPNVPEIYVHRIGRTARAGKSGRAVAFCDGSERSLLRDIEKLIAMRIPVAEAPEGEEIPATAAAPAPRAQTPAEPGKVRRPDHRKDGEGERRANTGKRRRRGRGTGHPQAGAEKAAGPRGAGAPGKRRRGKRKPAAANTGSDAGLQRMLHKSGRGR